MSQVLNYTPKSEEELLRIATGRVTPSYDEQLAIYQRQTAKKEGELQKQMGGLDAAYSRIGEQTEAQYDQKRQNISDSAMARGFGRSSYVTDMIAQTHDQQIGALSELTRQKNQEYENLGAQIENLYDQLFDNQARLSSAKQEKILSLIDSLRMEQDARELEVLKYNTDIQLRIQQLQQQQSQFEAQMAYNQQKLAADTAYRDQQQQMQKDTFAYQQAMDALKREAELAAAAAKAAKSGGSGSSSSSKTVNTGITFTGIR